MPPGAPDAALRTGFQTHGDLVEDNEWGINVQYYFEDLALEASFIYLNYVDKNLHGLHGGFDIGQLGNVAAGTNPLAGALLGFWNGACADGSVACPNAPVINPETGTIVYGDARWTFKEDIDLFGLSFAKEIAGISMGLDLVYRKDTGLAPGLNQSLQRFHNYNDAIAPFIPTIEGALGLGALPNPDYFSFDSSNYIGPVGDTVSVVVNGLGLLSDNGIWEGGSYIVEATFSMLENCNENCDRLDPRVVEGRVVSGIGAVFKPSWFQVMPGWDMSLPMSVSYTFHGKSPFTFGGDQGRGNASVGAEFNINETWNLTARYNWFFGPVTAGIGGLLKDRDNVSVTLKRTF